MSMIAKTMREIQDLTGIPYYKLSPMKFGLEVDWTAADDLILASQFVPAQQGSIVYRVECYTTSLEDGASDNFQHLISPPGTAWWVYQTGFAALDPPASNEADQTDRENPAHLILDVEEFLIFGGNQYTNLIITVDDPPNGEPHTIRTVVYGFFIPGEVYEMLRNQFNWISNTN